MRFRHGFLLVALAVMAGCAAGAEFVYTKPGVTEQQRERDKYECLVESTETVSGGYGGGPTRRVDTDRFQRCMQARGYEVKTKAE